MSSGDPHSFVDLSQPRHRHIDFDLHVDFDRRVVHGCARYELDRPCHGSLFMDSSDVRLESATAGDRRLEWTLDEQDAIRGQRLHLQGFKGEASLQLDFTSSEGANALQWLKPALTASGRYPFLYSQCQAIHARSIFPCQDTPAVRFTYTAKVRAPEPLTALMAAAHLGQGEDGRGRFTRFEMPQPIPSYLFALAVGELASRDLSHRCRVHAEPSVVESAAWEFAETESLLQQAEALFGSYLWDRYDLLVLPRSFPFSGMENPRLTFCSPLVITGDRSEVTLVAHELAHSWTGNLVTNATWEDFWINEGWTTYAESRLNEAVHGREIDQLYNAYNNRLFVDDVHRLGADSMLTCLHYDMHGVHPDDAFSTIPYVKGFFLLYKLEQAVGRTRFDTFVRKYIETYAFQSLTTEAFLGFLQQQLPEGFDKVPVEDWVYGPGYPDSAPTFQSPLHAQVLDALARLDRGVLPDATDVEAWIPYQRLVFITSLPERIPPEHVRHLDAVLGMSSCRSYKILSWFYKLAILSGDEAIYPRVEQFILDTGPMLAMARVVRSLAQAEWSRQLARPLFEKARPRLHPITERRIDRELADAGL